jgi:phosphatidylserine/phosphatidylglycerophosphate/cardiolipin synthase-like enzyme
MVPAGRLMAAGRHNGPVDVWTLTEGGQPAEDTAGRLATFIGGASASLELALYDVRLPDPVGSIVAGALREAAARGVAVRLLYNVDSGRPAELHPPPATRPELLRELPIDVREVSGIPDLMHHKYVVRDVSAVWTGSANWTVDSWSRQENVLAIVESEGIADAYRRNFEELWERRDVESSGRIEPDPVDVGGIETRAWFTPGNGPELSQAIASAFGSARRRIRIASPVITSAPILSTLAERAAKGDVDIAGVVDEPQTDMVFSQWASTPQSAWKIPLLAAVLDQLPFSGKQSTPWGPATIHDYMHAKVSVADDTVFLGSFNLSRSGEQNAENVLEIRDHAIADRMAAFVDQVRGRYPATSVPAQAIETTSAGSSQSVAISKSPDEIRPSSSIRARTQSSSPDQ